ncbi:cell division protein ZapC [Shewanella sp. OMA3-2]|uniref:cell division protein ZapC n=1 Tax=Shewanella sp. OMA3-2 TaxID=2908650 RepID=UPI001F298BB9|nr:cell division protein ZapC [Shewanella sp. OMA3-2]UJF20926.1 cell division protein ZapC [Shewanella sp. OMA3-2]
MLLMPNKDWHWEFSTRYQQLSVSLGSEMEFLTPYKTKQLIPDALGMMEFSVEHAKFYIRLLEILPKVLHISDAGIVQTALNATAAHFLLQPQMPKSWFFQASDECVYCDIGKIFQLNCNGVNVLVLVVEDGLQAATVMLLSNHCVLSDVKSLNQFDIIKVIHNRLHPLRKIKQVVAA